MDNESPIALATRNLRLGIPGAARSLGPDWSPKILVPFLVIQVSVIAVLSLRIFSSDMSGRTELVIVIPALIPLITWVIASAIRDGQAHRHLVSSFPQVSAFIFLSGLVLITVFLTLNEETLFVPAYYLFLLSTSIILLAVSESMDDSGYDWVELIDALIGGARSKSEMVLAMVPVRDKGKLSFRGSSEVGRSNVSTKGLGTGVLPIERRTQNLGYLVRNKEIWNPVTVHGLSILGRGFSIGAARIVEEQSLCSLLLIALHDPKDRWDKCKPQNLLSGDGDQKIELGNSGLIRIKHRWTEEELSNTAFTIANSISAAIGGQEVSRPDIQTQVNPPEKERKNPFDINKDGRLDFDDIVALWMTLDYNKDGRVNILDVLDALTRRKKERTKEDSFNEMLVLILGLEGNSIKGEEKASVINRHLTVGYLVSLSSLANMERDSLSEITWKEHITFFASLAKKLSNAVDEKEAEETTGEIGDSTFTISRNRTTEIDLVGDYWGFLKKAAERPMPQFVLSYDKILNDSGAIGDNAKTWKTFIDDFLGHTLTLMIDRIEVEPHGITPAELLEKRTGTVMASALLLEILSRYLEFFKDEG